MKVIDEQSTKHFYERQRTGLAGRTIWFATNDELNLSGSCLASVLGLHYMRSQRGSPWQATDDEIHDFILKHRGPGDEAV